MIDVFPFVQGAGAMAEGDVAELALNRWWRPQLTVVGASGLPPAATGMTKLPRQTAMIEFIPLLTHWNSILCRFRV
jgi:hypothetical protein